MPQLGNLQLGEYQLGGYVSVLWSGTGGAALTVNDTNRTMYVLSRGHSGGTFELLRGERGVSSVTFRVLDASWEPQVGQQVVWFDGGGVRRFVGSIDSITPTLISRVEDGYYYKCEIVSLEQRLDKRYVVTKLFENMTDGEIVRYLIEHDAAYDEAVFLGTIEDGEERERVVYTEKTTIWQAIQERAALNEFVAFVDPENYLYFGPPNATPAPFTIDDSVIFWEGHSLETNRADLRTRQHVRFNETAVPPEVDVLEGDGESDSYELRHNIRSIISVHLTTATQSQQTGTFSGMPSDGDTITIGAFTYTFKTTVDNRIGQHVKIGTSIINTCDNLARAINGTLLTPVVDLGNFYSFPTVAHFGVIATNNFAQLIIKSKFPGAWTNGEEPLSTTCANFSWDGAALEGGTDGPEEGGTMELSVSDDVESGDAQWTYIPGTKTLTKGPGRTTGFIWPGLASFGANAPAVGERLVVHYRPVDFDIVTLQDDSKVAARKAIEGISGIYEHVWDRSDLTDRNAAITAAHNALDTFGEPSLTLSFITNLGGLYPGQEATVSSTRLGISDTFVIETLTAEARGLNQGGGYLRYTVTAISGGEARSWVKTWEQFVEKQKQKPPALPKPVPEMRVATFIFGNERGPVDLFELETTNTPMVKHPGIAFSWDAIAEVAPVGADIIIDILKNGVSIFGLSAPKVTIPDGSTSKESGSAFAGVIELNTGDTLQGVVEQVGATVAGQNVTVQLYWRQ